MQLIESVIKQLDYNEELLKTQLQDIAQKRANVVKLMEGQQALDVSLKAIAIWLDSPTLYRCRVVT
jgi:hypothetical protein